MSILQIDHPVRSFEVWKAAFDGDPVGRQRGGVRRYQIRRPVDDPDYVSLELEFDDQAAAQSFRVALEELWRTPQAASALGGTPRTRILERVEGAGC